MAITKTITDDEISEALGHSGYLIESRLETLLTTAGYRVDSNSAYPDRTTGKSREVDLIAIKLIKLGSAESLHDSLAAGLTIECINNPQPLAFITKDAWEEPSSQDLLIVGIPIEIDVKDQSRMHIADFLKLRNYHHHFSSRVATQYCSFVRKKGDKEWMASHNEDQHNSFAALTAIEDLERRYKPAEFGRRISLTFNYSVMVLQGRLLDIRPNASAFTIHDANLIQYRRSSVVNEEYRIYLIDVVTENFFPEYLLLIERELKETASILNESRDLLYESIDRILRVARTPPEAYRTNLL